MADLIAKPWCFESLLRAAVEAIDHFNETGLIHPKLVDTWPGRIMAEQWDRMWSSHGLRCTPDTEVERIVLLPGEYRAFRQMGGQSA